jgi:hypothetical protein
MWTWIAIGTGVTLGLSALISLALLATIGHETGELFETEIWRAATAPRGRRAAAQQMHPSGT